jgi:hypothetical protein
LSELLEDLKHFKELIFEDIEEIKKIASNNLKLDDFREDIQQITDLDLQEYLFELYQQHSYNLFYEIDSQDGVNFISKYNADSISVGDIQLLEEDNLDQVVAKFIIKAFEEEMTKFLEQLKSNQFDLIFTEVQALKIKKKIKNL